jgi:hypothetical protein
MYTLRWFLTILACLF